MRSLTFLAAFAMPSRFLGPFVLHLPNMAHIFYELTATPNLKPVQFLIARMTPYGGKHAYSFRGQR